MTYTVNDLRCHPVWRHVATGSLCHVLGVATCSTNGDRENVEQSVIYFGIDCQGLRYREVSEFLDGRFVPEPPARVAGWRGAKPSSVRGPKPEGA